MTVLPGYKASVSVSTGVSTLTTNEAMTNAGDNKTFSIINKAHQYLDPATAVVVQTGLSEIQTITITGSPTGGTFTLTQGGQTTTPLNWNATAAQVQSALQALSSIGANNILVTGGPGPGTAFVAEWSGIQAPGSHTIITLTTNSLTGGVSPSVSIVRTQAGTSFATVSSGFTLQYCGAIVVFASSLGLGTASCRISSANYLTISQAALAKSVDFTTQIDIIDVSTFAGGVWKQKLALLGDATVKLSQWHAFDGFYLTNLGNLLVIVAYSGANANQQLACYALIKTDATKFDVKNAVEQSLDFESHGPVLYLQS